MPITKVPIVHKFGIISHSQRLELQERLLKQSYISALESKKPLISSRNPLEVTEEFVQEFNNAPNLEEQEKREGLARKMIERIKRRAGVKSGGTGTFVDLPVAWTELAQLAQCKGPIQEKCLDVLITSLDQAPLEKGHTPALFYLAETTLYWLRTEAIHQPYLRTGELKLLRMGQLVFTRLFYHHMAGQLQGQHEFKNRLFTYLDGFSECQEAYAPYPNALLSLRYINEVGKMIIGDFNTEAGDIKEGDNILQQEQTSERGTHKASTEKAFSEDCDNTARSAQGPTEERPCSRQSVVKRLFRDVSAAFEETQSSQSGAISSSVHDLSPTLWHALDVWRCVTKQPSGLTSAVRSLGSCGMGLASESWVDGIGAMLILADAAKKHMQPLKVMQNLARGVRPAPKASSSTQNVRRNADASEPCTSSGTAGTHLSTDPTDPSKQLALSDIYEKTEDNYTSNSEQGNSRAETSAKSGGTAGMSLSPETQLPVSGRTTGRDREQNDSVFDPVPDTAWAAEAGTDLPTGRASEASSVPTYSNQVFPDLPGIHGWHWEVVITYTDSLADICLHGATSTIQKTALVGTNTDLNDVHKQASTPRCPLPSAALLDLVFFHAAQESHDQGPNDWSWRVRYSAIQGLVKLCRCSASDPNKDGLRTVAWNTLIKAHSMEKDMRVLEALKVGQVDANIENLIQQQLSVSPSNIGEKMAAGLSGLYLPPLPPAVDPVSPRRPWQRGNRPVVGVSQTVNRKPLRNTLGQEIALATALYEPSINFEKRTGFDLRRIVEDQWRKDLQQQLEEEEVDRQKELAKKQKEEEEEQRQVEEMRAAKLGQKKQGKAYQYRTPSGTFLSPVQLKKSPVG